MASFPETSRFILFPSPLPSSHRPLPRWRYQDNSVHTGNTGYIHPSPRFHSARERGPEPDRPLRRGGISYSRFHSRSPLTLVSWILNQPPPSLKGLPQSLGMF